VGGILGGEGEGEWWMREVEKERERGMRGEKKWKRGGGRVE